MRAERAHGRGTTARLLAGLIALVLVGTIVGIRAGAQASPAVAAAVSESDATGFAEPFSGSAKYESSAPTEVAPGDQLHKPLGQREADRIARSIGLHRKDAFSLEQFRLFIRGKGNTGRKEPARVIDRSAKIFINTVHHPLYSEVGGKVTRSVLGSYGLYVTRSGLLQSMANTHAPTRKANKYLVPGGYLGQWCIANDAEDSLAALYR